MARHLQIEIVFEKPLKKSNLSLQPLFIFIDNELGNFSTHRPRQTDQSFVAFLEKLLINAGGDLSYKGLNSRDSRWRIGVKHPRLPDTISAIITTPSDPALHGLATSGDYEGFRIENGKRIHHLIDATTGQPVSDKQSVTAITSDALWADYYSTFLFLMPVDTLLKFVNLVLSIDSRKIEE